MFRNLVKTFVRQTPVLGSTPEFINCNRMVRNSSERIWMAYTVVSTLVSRLGAAYSDNDGKTWTGETVADLSTYAVVGDAHPALAVDGSGNVLVVVSVKIGTTGHYFLKAFYRTASTGLWGAAETADDASSESSGSHDIGNLDVDSSDSFSFISQRGNIGGGLPATAVYFHERVAGVWQTPVQLFGGGNSRLGDSRVAPNGDIVAVYDKVSPLHMRVRSGGIWGAESAAIVAASQWAKLTVDDLGNYHVVYYANPGGTARDIWYIKYSGGVWSTPVNISNTNNFKHAPNIAVDALEVVTAAWLDDLVTDKHTLYARNPGGVWSVKEVDSGHAYSGGEALIDAVNPSSNRIADGFLLSLYDSATFISQSDRGASGDGIFFMFSGEAVDARNRKLMAGAGAR